MKVMLIVPPRTILKSSIKRCCTPLGLAYIGAVLEQNDIDVRILDCYAEGYHNECEVGNEGYIRVGLDGQEIIDRIKEFKPDFIGVTCGFTSEIGNVSSVCRYARMAQPKAKIVIGGIHPSNYPEETIKKCPDADLIISGEGEYKFLNYILGKPYDNIPKIENLDELPFPARHLLKMDIYIKINKHISPYPKEKRTEQILTSRGCPGRCIFCTSSNFWGHKFRARSPENVIEEMKLLINKYNIKEFQFTDDTMTLDKKRAMKIFELMKPLNVSFCMANGVFVNSLDKEMIKSMSEAGCYQITFSVESGSEKSLKFMKKNVKLDRVKPLVDYSKKLGISCHSTFVLGFPGEKKEDIQKSFDFAKKVDFDSVSYFIVAPLPGSELYDMCINMGYINEMPFEKLDFKTARIDNPNLNPEEIEKMIVKENSRFIKRYFFRHPIKFFKKYGGYMKENPKKFYKIFGRVT